MPIIDGVNVVKSRSEARALLDRIWREGKAGKPASVDTEFGRDEKTNTEFVTVWSLSTGRDDLNCLYADPSLDVFRGWLADEKAPKVYHTYTADADSMADSGFSTAGLHADIWVMSAIVDSDDRLHDLKYLEKKYGIRKHQRDGFKETFSYVPAGKKKPVLFTWDEIFASKDLRRILYLYSALDAEGTIRLYNKFRHLMDKDGWNYFNTYLEVDRVFTLTLHNVMKRGFLVDKEKLISLEKEFEIKLLRRVNVFRLLAEEPTININSHPQLNKLFFGKLDYPGLRETKTGYSTDNDTLEKWAEAGLDLAQRLLDVRELGKLKSTFVTGVLRGLDADGRLYSDLNQVGASATGRISSRKYDRIIQVAHEKKDRKTKEVTTIYKFKKVKVGANLQNIPARSDEGKRIREVFIAEPGRKLVISDLAGAEWWMMGHFSRDPEIMAQYKEKKDPHSVSAVFLFQLPKTWEEVKALAKGGDPKYYKYRYDAKTCNFALIYDASATRVVPLIELKDIYERFTRADGRKVRKLVESAVDQAQTLKDRFFQLYQGIKKYHVKTIQFARDHGYVTTISGRRRHLPDIWSDDEGIRGWSERAAINARIQGSIADIIKKAMNDLEFNDYMQRKDARMLLQVHDEIIWSVPDKHAEDVRAYVEKFMPQPYSDLMEIKLKAEAKVASSWAEK